MRISSKIAGLGAILSTLVACGGETAAPRDQWKVVVTTDANVPQFGDRVLIEVIGQDGELACSACRRQLGVNQSGSLSFGIVAEGAPTPTRMRVRLYRAIAAGIDGLPASDRLLDRLGTLPTAQELSEVHVHLSMSCFGVPSQPDQGRTCDPNSGELAAEPVLGPPPSSLPSAGSWPPGQDQPCDFDVPDDMVCVEGGAFLLGTEDHFSSSGSLAPLPERLVTLSPFALDRREVTVGTVRRLVNEGRVPAPVVRGSVGGSEMCTYLGASEAANDDYPANCLPSDVASAVCVALGKELPTEAQFEYAAGNRDLETAYPWGHDESFCTNAHLGLGRGGLVTPPEEDFCIGKSSDQPGPQPGMHTRDVTEQGVHDLGGNVSEWLADRFARYHAPCWQPNVGILRDPVCTDAAPPQDSPTAEHVIRGSAWDNVGLLARASTRNATVRDDLDPSIGFRCAKNR